MKLLTTNNMARIVAKNRRDRREHKNNGRDRRRATKSTIKMAATILKTR